MHAHARAVDHLHLAVVRRDDGVHQSVPDARLAPAVEAIVNGCVGPVALGQIAPRRAGAQDVEHAADDLPVVLRLRSPPIQRKQRLDDAPLEVGQIVAHDPSSDVSELESLFALLRHRKLSTLPSLLSPVSCLVDGDARTMEIECIAPTYQQHEHTTVPGRGKNWPIAGPPVERRQDF